MPVAKTTAPSNDRELRAMLRMRYGEQDLPHILLRSEGFVGIGGQNRTSLRIGKPSTAEITEEKRIVSVMSEVLGVFSLCSGKSYELPIISLNPGFGPNQGLFHQHGEQIKGDNGFRVSSMVQINYGAKDVSIAHEAMHYARHLNRVFPTDAYSCMNPVPFLIEEMCGCIAECVPAITRDPGFERSHDINMVPRMLPVKAIFSAFYGEARAPMYDSVSAYKNSTTAYGYAPANIACELDINNLETVSHIAQPKELEHILTDHVFSNFCPMTYERALLLMLFTNNRFNVGITIRDALTGSINHLRDKLVPDAWAATDGVREASECLRSTLHERWPQERKEAAWVIHRAADGS